MSFKPIIGQMQACEILSTTLRNERVPHAYLFVGPEGVGKRTTAIQWAKILNCPKQPSPSDACEACLSCQKISARNHPDVLWINFEWQAALLGESVEKQRVIKIDTLRKMEEILHLKSMEGKYKIALIDPADRLGLDAAHTILKILEEPPPQTHLVLLAQDPSQLLGTIRSRCQWVRFGPLPTESIVKRLESQGYSREDADRAAAWSDGSLRKALDRLEEGGETVFEWESAPLSELVSWCEQFHGVRLGRPAAEKFLQEFLVRSQQQMTLDPDISPVTNRILNALHHLRQNVSPQLVLETLLLRLRYEKRVREAGVRSS